MPEEFFDSLLGGVGWGLGTMFARQGDKQQVITGLWSLTMEQNIPTLVWTLQGFSGTLKPSLSHCNILRIKHFSISFIIYECSLL